VSRPRLIRHGRLALASDTTPDAFTFTDVTSAPLSTTETSNTITIAGLGSGVSVAVTVTGGTYSKNGGSYVSSAGTAQNGDTFAVRHTSSSSNSTATNTVLTVGGVSDTFTSTTVASSAAITYDTAIGNGVDSSGFADLPLRAGAKRFFVRGGHASASDAHTITQAQDPTTPLNTFEAARVLVTDSAGDQIMVAEGTTYSPVIGSFNGRRGFSALYPTCIRSYDPADPTNTAKYGRATTNRPTFTAPGVLHALGDGGSTAPTQPAGKLALQGLAFIPSSSQMGLDFVCSNSGTNDFILVESCIFASGNIGVTQRGSKTGRAQCVIVRNCAIYGRYGPSISGLYIDWTIGVTLEDNVLWNCGWKVGGSRDDDPSIGGASSFNHAYYFQEDGKRAIVRRNLIADPSSDGGQNRPASVVQDNFYLDPPIAIPMASGAAYYLAYPNGTPFDCRFNVVLGDADLNSTNPRRWGIDTANGKQNFSDAAFNLLVKSNNIAGTNSSVLGTEALFNQPSYTDFRSNISYQRVSSGRTKSTGGSFPAQNFPTYATNIWDDPASGTNQNISSYTPATAYTAAALYSALGYADKAAFIAYAIAHPEAHIQRTAIDTLRTGYSVPAKPVEDVRALVELVCGQTDATVLIGTIDGWSYSILSGGPTGLTLDNTTRSLSYDGTGSTASSGTMVVRGTDGTTTHDSSIAWVRAVAPSLSAISVTAITSTTATINFTTDVGSGTAYWVLAWSIWGGSIWNELYQTAITNGQDRDYDLATTNGGKAGSQTVSTTGAQSINVTGLTSGKTYYLFLVHRKTASPFVASPVAGQIGTISFTTP
jgi:hypothetical protein